MLCDDILLILKKFLSINLVFLAESLSLTLIIIGVFGYFFLKSSKSEILKVR